jgi:small-conductance mechanosensitive channel
MWRRGGDERAARSATLTAVEALEARLHPNFRRAVICGVLALAALIAGGSLGGLHGHHHPRRHIAALVLAGVFLVLGVMAVRSAGNEAARVTQHRAGPATAAAVQIGTSILGFLIVLVATLDMLNVPVQRLLVGGAITGVVLGISAQQSLGNVSAGILLLIARPFAVGEYVTIKSGSLGGPLCGTISSIGLVYTTLQTKEGRLALPNSGLLTAAVGSREDPGQPSIDLPKGEFLIGQRR